jgi:diguanylate cyclase (GGDEF)-like protein
MGRRSERTGANVGAHSAEPSDHTNALALPALTQALMNSREVANARIEALVERVSSLETELSALARKEAQARHLAHHDALTGLPNPTLLQDRAGQAIACARRNHAMVALLLIDLDGLRSVNDRLGEDAGDKVLRAVAERLLASVRCADTAARYGGDEFVIILSEVESPSKAAAVADKVRAHLCEPHFIDGYSIWITASVGAALYPNDAETYEQLIRHADINMCVVKLASCDVRIAAATDEPATEVDLRPRALLPSSGYPSDLGPS